MDPLDEKEEKRKRRAEFTRARNAAWASKTTVVKRKAPVKVQRASTLEGSTWTVVGRTSELRTLLRSLCPAPGYTDEARLRSALMHLEPKFSAAMDADSPEDEVGEPAEAAEEPIVSPIAAAAAAAAAAGAACAEMEVESVKELNKPPMVNGPLSTSDGVLGAICTSCYVQTDEVLLCDGIEEKGYACPAEWCFSCAGVTSLPEGDWKCSTCQAATMPDGRKMKLKLKLTLK